MMWFETRGICLAGYVCVASTPARVNEFPFTSIDAAEIPGVICLEWRYRFARPNLSVAAALAGTMNHNNFKTGFDTQGSEQTSVAFANRQARSYRRLWRGALYSVVA